MVDERRCPGIHWIRGDVEPLLQASDGIKSMLPDPNEPVVRIQTDRFRDQRRKFWIGFERNHVSLWTDDARAEKSVGARIRSRVDPNIARSDQTSSDR